MPVSSQAVVEDLGAALARHVVTTGFDALPAEAVQAARYSTLDTMGVILGASGLMDVMPGIVGLARDWAANRKAR